MQLTPLRLSASHPQVLVQVWEQSTLQELKKELALSARLNITSSPLRSSHHFFKAFDDLNNYTNSIFVIFSDIQEQKFKKITSVKISRIQI